MKSSRTFCVATVVVSFALAGCGSASSSDEVERLEQRVQDAEQKAADAQAAADDARNDNAGAADVSDEAPTEDVGESRGSGCINVPNVVDHGAPAAQGRHVRQ
jgi:hypothetical protein